MVRTNLLLFFFALIAGFQQAIASTVLVGKDKITGEVCSVTIWSQSSHQLYLTYRIGDQDSERYVLRGTSFWIDGFSHIWGHGGWEYRFEESRTEMENQVNMRMDYSLPKSNYSDAQLRIIYRIKEGNNQSVSHVSLHCVDLVEEQPAPQPVNFN